jgi:hypothetical protein
MPLQPCRECGKEVSTEAAACPHCGAATPTRQKTIGWSPCPNCGGANTRKMGAGFMGFVSLIAGSCLLWIPIIGWILAPLMFLAAVVLWIVALFPSASVSYQCQACKQWFRVPKANIPAR